MYALYYYGDFELYGSMRCSDVFETPIYVGKAVPEGWRTARVRLSGGPVLRRRLSEHARNIGQTGNLRVRDFKCRFMILDDLEGDLVVPIEAELIRKLKPLWNTSIDGFGNHDPGIGRYNQARSEWDVLHPGRPWAVKLTGESPLLEDIVRRIRAR